MEQKSLNIFIKIITSMLYGGQKLHFVIVDMCKLFFVFGDVAYVAIDLDLVVKPKMCTTVPIYRFLFLTLNSF